MTRGSTLPLLALALALAACTVDPDPGPRTVHEEPYTRPSATVSEVEIVQAAPLVSPEGEGAGVFVELRGDGDWAVTTACDTKVTYLTCTWDVLIEARGATIDSAKAPPGREGGAVITLASGKAELHAASTSTNDGVLFHVTDPAAAVRVEAWLDGRADPRVFYWTGPDVIHEGAPSNPVDFVPTAP